MTTGSDNKSAAGTGVKASAPADKPAEAAPRTTSAQPATTTAEPSASAASAAPTATTGPAAPAARPASSNRATEASQPGPVRRFVRSVVSHLAFAGVVTLGVLGYIFHAQILRDVGDRVCAENVLGQYMSVMPAAVRDGNNASGVASGIAAGPVENNSNSAAAPVPSAPHAAETAPPALAESTASPTAKSGEAVAEIAETKAKPSENPGVEAVVIANSGGEPVLEPATQQAAAAAEYPPENTPVVAAAAQPVVTTEPTATQPAAPNATAAATPATGPAAESRSGISLARDWQAAREAYVARKPEAVDAYRALAESYPDMPEITGELGNIYYSEKRYAEAGEQYLETARRLLKQNRAAEASCMTGVLSQIAPDKAQQLRAMTSVACQRQQ